MGIDPFFVICDLDHYCDIFTGDPNSNDHDALFITDTFAIMITIMITYFY